MVSSMPCIKLIKFTNFETSSGYIYIHIYTLYIYVTCCICVTYSNDMYMMRALDIFGVRWDCCSAVAQGEGGHVLSRYAKKHGIDRRKVGQIETVICAAAEVFISVICKGFTSDSRWSLVISKSFTIYFQGVY